MADLSEEELQALYCWIDQIPLSRTKKNITRDFSDGVLTAEIVHHFLPQLVELHNYPPANSSSQKIENWRTLNRKVFLKLNLSLPDDIIQSVAASKPGVIEFILTTLRTKIERYLQNKAKEYSLDNGYAYDPDGLATAEIDANYEHFDQQRHVGPATNPRPQGVAFAQPVEETGYIQPPYNSSHMDYVHVSQDMAIPRAPAVHAPFPSKLRPPTLYHHHPPHPSHLHNSTALPPIPDMSHCGAVPPRVGGGGGGRGGGVPKAVQTCSKLPTIIHGRSKTYAGRANRIGPGPTDSVPVTGMGAVDKRIDSAKQKIRLAEKEQKLYENQEFIQLLQMKVTRLEHLVQIKDMKIYELQRQLALASRHPLHKR